MESVSPDDVRIGFLGSFLSPSLEQDYRRQHLREDARLGLGCALVALVGSVVFLLNGYRLYGTLGHFRVLLVSRTAIILASVALVLVLRRFRTPAWADRALLVWCLVVAAGNLTIIATRSCGNFGHAVMSLGIPLLAYCIVPLPLARQLLVTIAFSVAALLAALWSGIDTLTLGTLAGAYLIANAIGSFASWQHHHRRRHAYLAAISAARLRAELEQALAEREPLPELLTICRSCNRIHDGKGGWQPVELYLQSHRHAAFTQGLCDQCQEKFGKDAPRRRLNDDHAEAFQGGPTTATWN